MLVLEMVVPDARAYPGGQALRVAHVGVDEVVLQVALYDAPAPVVDGATVVLADRGVRVLPARARNLPVPELDLLAEVAGLTLAHRWADWARSPFACGADHVSVFRRAG